MKTCREEKKGGGDTERRIGRERRGQRQGEKQSHAEELKEKTIRWTLLSKVAYSWSA